MQFFALQTCACRCSGSPRTEVLQQQLSHFGRAARDASADRNYREHRKGGRSTGKGRQCQDFALLTRSGASAWTSAWILTSRQPQRVVPRMKHTIKILLHQFQNADHSITSLSNSLLLCFKNKPFIYQCSITEAQGNLQRKSYYNYRK